MKISLFIKNALFIIAVTLACNALMMSVTTYVPWFIETAMHRLLAVSAAAVIIAVIAATLKPRSGWGFALLAAITGISLLAAYGACSSLGWIK